jgi:predicted DNA-binding ArsR family transcriptional regulator
MRKNVTAEKLVASAWAAALAGPKVGDKVPAGWHTARELSEMIGKSTTRTYEMLQKALRQGKCERREFRIPAAGTVRPVPHYRLL